MKGRVQRHNEIDSNTLLVVVLAINALCVCFAGNQAMQVVIAGGDCMPARLPVNWWCCRGSSCTAWRMCSVS